MRIHHGEYFYNFDGMYAWADFDLRKNHAYILRGGYGQRLEIPKHIKPNLLLIDFHEIRYHKGQLVMWNSRNKAWGNVYPGSEQRQKEITKLYEDYVFEQQFLSDRRAGK